MHDKEKSEDISLIKKSMNAIKKFIDKDNYIKIKIAILIVLACVLSVISEKTIMRRFHPEPYISKNRMMLLAMIYGYIGLHFIFKISKMYEWIHNNRYKIACAFLLFVMAFKYSGSSIVNFNEFIQKDIDSSRYHTILGKARMIRTDEWATSTTYILSQAKSNNGFSYFSDTLRGTPTDMFTVSNSPVFDILMLGRPLQTVFMILGNEYGLSFYWFSRIVLMLLGSYELCLILSNKNKKISLLGMIMITFSAATQWWYCMDTLIWGQIIMVLLDKFMLSKEKKYKYLCALGLIVACLSYVFVFYPAWLVSFGYIFVAIAIWILIKNIKYEGYRFSKHDILVIIVTCLIIIAILGRWYMLSKDTLALEMNTDYPGERQETGGHATYNLFSYFYNIYFAWVDYLNPCEFSSMLSFYPLPMILGIVYVIRNRKDLHFWIPTLVVSAVLSIWCIWGFPAVIANITKLSMAQAGRATVPLGTLSIYMLIYLLARFNKSEDKLINKYVTIAIAIAFTGFIAYESNKTIGFKPDFIYLDLKKNIIAGVLFLAASLGILNFEKKDWISTATICLIIFIALITGLRVNPIISTTDIFYTKPVAVKLNEIKDQDPDAKWLVVDGGWYYNDYALASGVKTINSTQVYPNFKLFEDVLGKDEAQKEEVREIYNRYAHIIVNIVSDRPSSVELIFLDTVQLNINIDDINKTGAKYILTTRDLLDEGYTDKLTEMYNEDDMYIYQIMEGNK